MLWEFSDDRPIYAQLVEQIQLRIVAGVYPAGTKLPSVRDLANEASVNPNTMQKALSELERNGLVHSQRTTGRFITDNQELITKTKSQLAEEKVKSFFDDMAQLGYSIQEAFTLLTEHAKEEV